MCLGGHWHDSVSATFVQEKNGPEADPESVRYTLAVRRGAKVPGSARRVNAETQKIPTDPRPDAVRGGWSGSDHLNVIGSASHTGVALSRFMAGANLIFSAALNAASSITSYPLDSLTSVF